MLALSRQSPSRAMDSGVGGLDSVISTSLEQLLSTPLEFVEGSSSGILAVAEGKYRPINVVLVEHLQSPIGLTTEEDSKLGNQGAEKDLHTARISLHHPPEIISAGAGYLNIGNTCFLNSVLQCLLHAPPLLNLLREHQKTTCRVSPGFCATCKLRELMMLTYGTKRFISPEPIVCNLGKIAKHFRRGRQEDAHEFLRYLIEALQNSCLAGLNYKVDNRMAETSWVHRIFGGRLRSRVKCRSCDYPSDTFDSILDLSIDINGIHTLKESLYKFVKLDVLKGADRYKCDKCKQFVIADKGFTVHEAPIILTIHMKRFTPFGRKLTNLVRYEESLDLQPYMSEGCFGPKYRLFGVINHAGNGPNSGHYYAFVKSSKNRWFEMNDESVEPRRNIVAERNAYILLYVQEPGEALRNVIMPYSTTMKGVPSPRAQKRTQGEEDVGESACASRAKDTGSQSPSSPGMSKPEAIRSTKGGPLSRDVKEIINPHNAPRLHGNLHHAEATVAVESRKSEITQASSAPKEDQYNLSQYSPGRIVLKRKTSLTSTKHHTSGGDPTSNKKIRMQGNTSHNPYGGRDQYRDNLNSYRSVRETGSLANWSRSSGIHQGMKKKKRSLM